jgi:hypothetical protein
MRRLKELVRVLEALPDEIKNNNALINVPSKSPFLGLISIVAEEIPALKRRYKRNAFLSMSGNMP